MDPIISDSGTSRVYRGGSWLDYAANCRSAYRFPYAPKSRTFNFGFRLALNPSVKSPAAEQGAKSFGVGTE